VKHALRQVAHPYVQKVAGLPRRDSSQPDWKFFAPATQTQKCSTKTTATKEKKMKFKTPLKEQTMVKKHRAR